MKTILCATDFSDNAYAAAQYAANLAQDLNASLTLFHAYQNYGPLINSQEVMMEQPIGTDHRPEAVEKLYELTGKLQELREDLVIQRVAEEVEIIHGIREYMKQNPTLMVVMGFRGKNEEKTTLFGSTAYDAMRELNGPVLAIPKNAIYQTPKKILYASELEAADRQVIDQLISLTKSLRPEIYVAHFFEEENMILQQDADDFKQALERENKYPRLVLTSQTYGDLEEYVSKEIEEREAQWLVLRERDHGLTYRLFHQDFVKKMMKHTQLPLLVYNTNPE